MRIVDIRETAIPLKSNLRNSVFDFSEMTTSVVAVLTDVVRDGRPVAGYAFNSTGSYACGAQMRSRFVPRVLSTPPEQFLDADGTNIDPAKVAARMMQREKPGGHSERSVGIGTIEVAVWDACAKIAGKSLPALLADRYGGTVPERIFCYVGGGWYEPGKGIPELQDEMRRHLDAGYTMVKMKVGGMSVADDCRRIEAVIAVMGSADRVAVDANAAFDRTRALEYAAALAPFGLRWFEEPCDPIDYASYAAVAAAYPAPIGTGENLFSTMDVENMLRFGGMRADRDILQTDVPQSYGIAQFMRTLDCTAGFGWTRASIFPHGGNQMTAAIVAGLGLGGCESYPGVFGIFGGFADDARIESGYMRVPQRPGIGFEAHSKLYPIMKELAGL